MKKTVLKILQIAFFYTGKKSFSLSKSQNFDDKVTIF